MRARPPQEIQYYTILVCVKLQSAVWKSCLIQSDDSDGDGNDQLQDIQSNAIEQLPQISLQSNGTQAWHPISRNDPIANESTFNGTPGNMDESESFEETEPSTTVHTNIYYGAPFLGQ